MSINILLKWLINDDGDDDDVRCHILEIKMIFTLFSTFLYFSLNEN